MRAGPASRTRATARATEAPRARLTMGGASAEADATSIRSTPSHRGLDVAVAECPPMSSGSKGWVPGEQRVVFTCWRLRLERTCGRGVRRHGETLGCCRAQHPRCRLRNYGDAVTEHQQCRAVRRHIRHGPCRPWSVRRGQGRRGHGAEWRGQRLVLGPGGQRRLFESSVRCRVRDRARRRRGRLHSVHCFDPGDERTVPRDEDRGRAGPGWSHRNRHHEDRD